MKITYTIWQGSLMKGRLTANSMKEIITLIDELNEGKPPLKFEYLVHEIKQVAQWNSTQTQSISLYMLTTYIQAVQQQKSLHGYQWEQLHQYGQLDNGKNNWQSILLSN